MLDSEGYELLDFGDGRKLERFGDWMLDRPSPAARDVARQRPDYWSLADASFHRQRSNVGHWQIRGRIPANWPLVCESFSMQLKLTPFGHVGIFPEQQENWRWIADQLAKRQAARLLNLFAYTGGSSLAAAAAGAQVVHVDSARNVVQWARKNAELAGLGAAPIRWITEDARRFVDRELRRGHQYEAIILDPPSYGHGPQQEAWRLTNHLAPLLRNCARLLSDSRAFVLLTCHSPGFGPSEVAACLQQHVIGHCSSDVHAQTVYLRTRENRRLAAGTLGRLVF
jgi:23S rRNA (cytosine1962-C5)-methyltransferase